MYCLPYLLMSLGHILHWVVHWTICFWVTVTRITNKPTVLVSATPNHQCWQPIKKMNMVSAITPTYTWDLGLRKSTFIQKSMLTQESHHLPDCNLSFITHSHMMYQPFTPGSKESRWYHVAGKTASPTFMLLHRSLSAQSLLSDIHFSHASWTEALLLSSNTPSASKKCLCFIKIKLPWFLYFLRLFYTFITKKKGKEISVETWTGSDGSRSLGLLDFMTIGTWRQ